MIKAICFTILVIFALSAHQVPAQSAVKKNSKPVTKPANSKVFEISIEKEEKNEWKPVLFKDETAPSSDKNQKKTVYKNQLLNDEKILMSQKNKNFKKKTYTGVVKTEQGIKVVLRPTYKIKTGSKSVKIVDKKQRLAFPEIGQTVSFVTEDDVIKDGIIIIPKKTKVEADICEVSLRAMGGAPAEMSLDNFVAVDKKGKRIPLDGIVSVSGYNLSMWIGVVELATTPFLVGFAAPALRIFPGGQANLTPRKTYVVFYTN